MDVRLLGPLEVAGTDGEIELKTAKIRTLFAVLAVASPQAVSADALAEALWGESQPADPTASLHSYMSRLRRALGPDRDRIHTTRGTYRLDLSPEEVDGHRVEAMIRQAESEVADGDLAEAAQTLRDATQLFRAQPLVEFADEPFAEITTERWAELRATALELKTQVDLALGRHESVVPELESLIRIHPYREGLWRQLMVGLDRLGRPADIEQAWQQMRTVYRRDLGVEPSEETQSLAARLTAAQTEANLEPTAKPVPPTRVERHGASAQPRRVATRGVSDNPLESARSGPFVGRRASLQAIEADLSEARVIVGEPGIGKTRLVAEICHRAQNRGIAVFVGACSDHGTLAFEPLSRALDVMLSTETGRSLLPEDTLIELGRVVPGLADGAGLAPPRYVESTGALALVAGAVRELLSRAADPSGAILVLEDVHWADPETCQLIAELCTDRPDGVGLVLTSRPLDEGADHVVWHLLGQRRITGLQLKGLSETAISALMTDTSGVDMTVPSTEWLHRASGGNPFLAIELLKASDLAEAGEDRVLANEAVLSLVHERIDRLSSGATEVLDLVAVSGGSLSLDALETCVDQLVAIDEAVMADVLVEQPRGSVTFAHLILRDALLARLGPSARRALHERVGTALVAAQTTVSEAQLVEAARHLAAAGSAEGAAVAATALEHAAEQALRRGAYSDAVRGLRTALELLDDPEGVGPRAASLSARLALALRLSGERSESLEVAATTLSMRGADLDATVLADAAILAAPLRPDPRSAGPLRSALARLGDGDLGRRASLLVELGWSLMTVDPVEGGRYVAEGAELAERCGNHEAESRALDYQWETNGLVLSPSHRLERAWHLAGRAADAGDRLSAAHGHLHRLIAHLELGDRRSAETELERVNQLAGEIRTPVLLARAAQARGMWAHLNGDLAVAEQAANEVFQLVPGDPSFVPVYGGQILAINKELGQLQGMVELIQSDEANRAHLLARSAMAMIQAEFGPYEAAQAQLSKIVASEVEDMPPDMSWLVTMAILAETAVLLEDQDAVEALWPHLLPHEDRFVIFGYGAVCWGVVHRFLAPMALVLGNRNEARHRYGQSIARHRSFGAVPYLARDLYGLASMTADDDPDAAAALFAESHELAERHGLLSIAWDAEDRLAKLKR